MAFARGRTSRMAASWGLSVSLGSSWSEKEASPARTTTSGQPTSPSAYVSMEIIESGGSSRRGQTAGSAVRLTTAWLVTMVTAQSLLSWPGADDDWWCPDDEYLTEISECLFSPLPSCLFLSIGPCPLVSPSPVPCMSNFTAPSGTVLSPDYPEGYGNNMNCVWLIQSDPGSRIHLAFNDFDLEAPYDSLTVKDGETNDALVIGRFTGAESPSHLTSNTNILRLEFQADHSMSGRGFNITYSSMSSLSAPVRSKFLLRKMTKFVSTLRQ